MEQLSSCYFCGAALDAQIEPYQVVPASLEPTEDHQRAVSLCPSCRQKLAQVVETVVAVTDEEAGSAIVDDAPALEPEGELLEQGSTDAAAGIGASDAGEQSASDQRDSVAGGEEHDDTSEQSADGTNSTAQESVRTIERTRASQSQQGDGGQQRDRGQSGSRPGQSDDPLSTDGQRSSDRNQPTSDPEPSGQRSDRQNQTSSGQAQQSSGTDDPTSATADDGPSLTALEYNKVMRLLQNRDFPVERAEIQAVAINAYEISDQEFDAIIDAAIQRGLIGEENGQLVSGD